MKQKQCAELISDLSQNLGASELITEKEEALPLPRDILCVIGKMFVKKRGTSGLPTLRNLVNFQ